MHLSLFIPAISNVLIAGYNVFAKLKNCFTLINYFFFFLKRTTDMQTMHTADIKSNTANTLIKRLLPVLTLGNDPPPPFFPMYSSTTLIF